MLKEFGIHESEWAWYGLAVDYTVDNNSTLNALYAKVTEIVKI
jgi:hypothetical protein